MPKPNKTPSKSPALTHAKLRPFRKRNLLEAALTHPSYRTGRQHLKNESFDRLEFFGDSVLNFVICRALMKHFPEADEGEMSRLRSTLVSRKMLARIAKSLKLKRLIKVGPGIKNEPPQAHEKILSDSFEALLAAIFLDQGFLRTEQFLLDLFQPYFDPKRLNRLDPNPKSSLQILSQRHWQKLPEYEITEAPEGFTAHAKIHSKLKASAQGKTKKEAEEKAARVLVKKIRQDFAGALKKSSDKKLSRAR